jgi:hypothetical protein
VSPRKVIRSPIKQATFCSYNAEICKSGTSANGQAKKKDFYLSLPGNIGTKFRNSQRFPKKKKRRSRRCYKKQKETNEEPSTGNFLLQSGFPKSVLSSVASFFCLNDGIFFEIVHLQPQYILYRCNTIFTEIRLLHRPST